MPILLSLVIPVYKAERFIEACLHSVFTQIPIGVEVILVDDGTPDESIGIVKDLFSERIECGQLILLEQINMGPGAARNTGLRKSRGDYIAFLDSDDVLMPGYFDAVACHLRSGIADIVEFGFKRFNDQANISNEIYHPLYNFEGLQQLTDVRDRVFSAGCWYPSTRIYRRWILEKHIFPEGTHYEDLMMIPFIYLEDLKVFFIDKPLLGYRFNQDSITSRHNEKQLGQLYSFYKSIPLDTECVATKILKLKTARGIVFFQSELKVPGFPLEELVAEIRSMRLTLMTLRQLRMADRLFFHFPALYAHVDKFRVPAKRLLARMMSS
jgi:glycosyltransferase involved in cell wall biosynthesis